MDNKNLIKKVIEKPAKRQFDKLLLKIKDEIKPETYLENLIVSKIVFDYMRLYRVMEFETKEILSGQGITNHLDHKTINGFISYKNSIERSINTSYNLVKGMIRSRIGPRVVTLRR